MKKIGIIGGAGQEAGALLFKNIIRIYQQNGAWEDHHFPRIMLLSNNFSPMINSDANQMKITEEIQTSIDLLDNSHNEVVGIACNTLHSFVQNIDFKRMKFISIVDAVIDTIQQQNKKTVLFLGTKTSVHAKIYETTDTIKIIYPTRSQQELIQDCIVRILKNQHSQKDSLIITTIIDECRTIMDFNGVILGCTELSVIHQNFAITSNKNAYIFDPIAILAHKLTAS